MAYLCWILSELMELWLAKPSPRHSALMKKNPEKLIRELIPWYLRPSETARNRGEIFKKFESFMLPPGNTVILLFDGGKRMRQERGVDVKFASKLDFRAEALVAYPGLLPLSLIYEICLGLSIQLYSYCFLSLSYCFGNISKDTSPIFLLLLKSRFVHIIYKYSFQITYK